jgi:DNA recombination protein Rad52
MTDNPNALKVPKMNWSEVTKHLVAPLSPDAIKPPPKGKFGEYVDGLHVIREANRIFGHDGWSYEVTRLEMSHRAIVDLTYNGETKQQVRCSYLCAVRVNVAGVIREGLAVGVGNGKPENEGDVIESAVKEAETDALKRALRTFGNTFGLALYDKDKANREVGYALIDQTEEVARLTFLIEKAPDVEALKAVKATEKPALDALTDDSFGLVKAAFSAASQKFKPEQKEVS